MAYNECMDYKTLQERALQISELFDSLNIQKNQKVWNESAVMAGLVGDVGDLSKLIMAKNNLRTKENIDDGLAHELSDCLWSILVLAHKLNIDLPKSFMQTMDSIEQKISQKLNS